MKLHLNLSLRRALMAAMAVACALSSTTVTAGVVDERYDLQYYLDFCYNKGMFAAGATNISVFYKDGTSITNNTIPLMPNLDSYGRTVASIIGSTVTSNGGTNLVSSQFVYGAKHVHAKAGNSDVAFLTENAAAVCVYDSANLDNFGTDSAMQRLTKLVTSVAYTPMADDDFMRSLSVNTSWLYRLGNGGTWCNGDSIATGDNALGGVVNLSVKWQDTNTGEWYLEGWARKNEQSGDTLTPLDIGAYYGDSGSPCIAWDDENEQFVFVGAMFAGGCQTSLPNWYIPRYNYQLGSAVMDKYTVTASFNGTDTILWGASDAATGKGTLTQGSGTAVDYTGKGTDNSLGDSLGLTFSTDDTSTTRELQLQGNVNMGAGALTFENGKWRITETEGNNFSLSSAGFDISKGAEVTWELTGVSGQEIRKVGEGILTVAGSGNNAASLVVGGGTTVYNITRDENGNITGCTLGNAGETRLNRTDGYAASSVRLEGGVAILVLMADNQFKTNSVAGDTFSFGNAGGLLNLNGHDLSWGVINQDGSGTGARIGNFTPSDEDTPDLATFTYTGTSGTFAGSFMDEGADGAQLAVKYNSEGGTWKLTGQSNNVGGYTVEAGTMVLEGTNTPHVRTTDRGDWTYASIETSGVTVKSGASFQLSHHALLQGNVTVEEGGSFILNQTVNAASESVSGSLRQDMASLGITSLVGNVTLNGAATMTVNTNSPVATTMKGDIISNAQITGEPTASFTKTGNGIFVVDGQMGYVIGNVEAGGLVITDSSKFGGYFPNWTIGEQGFLAVQGMTGKTLAGYLNKSSSGVLALTSDQLEAIDLTYTDKLYIGAYGDTPIEYGTSDLTLSANSEGNWLLGGGTGTLNVNFILTGDNDLIIGNDYSSGTVHLTNTANDFTGDIYIKGTGNMLTYVDGALGNARVALSYGNTLALNDVNQLSILKDGAEGVLALTEDMALNLSDKSVSIGAAGDLTLTGNVQVSDDTYRFGGKGNLTLDTNLSSANKMELDGQGNTGSSVTFARENAFTGDIVAGGGLHLESPNSEGDIAIHVGHESALAAASSVNLQTGAVLYTDGNSIVVNNLSAQSGAGIQNNGETASLLQLNVDSGKETLIADGVLNSASNNATLSLVKTGAGTLEMGGNTSWSGGLTIMEGTVKGSIAAGGIGAAGAAIYVDNGAKLQLTSGSYTSCKDLEGTLLQQKLSGTGEVSISNGNDMLFLNQAAGFAGQVIVTGNTRLYITQSAALDAQVSVSTSGAFDNATIVVETGSQARVTPSIFSLSTTAVNSWANYVISGSVFNGGSSGLVQSQDDGALLVDCMATVWGNVTLADDAMISSWSHNPTESRNFYGNYPYYCGPASENLGNHYGVINSLGGIIRGQILGTTESDGTVSDLTIGGNEGMTITADSANTFGDLQIANGNGHNYNDSFALQLNGGAARSQVSTALGTGNVTLKDGLILRLAGTGTADMSDVVYTYANNISAGDGATLQSYNITNKLTGTVSMSGNSLNLATANGGVLELTGGISGSGTLNVGANSVIILGSAAETLSRSTTPQFSGTVAAEAGADITLASSAVVSDTTAFTGTDSLTLRFGGTDDYTLGGITMSASEGSSSVLTLNFDFTGVPSADDAATWATLSSSVSADKILVALDLNMFNDIASGEYTLVNGTLAATEYEMVDDLNGRLSLDTNTSGNLVLVVGGDNRLYWRTAGASQEWNTTDANWYLEGITGNTTFTAGKDVVFDANGVAAGNSATSRETVSLTADPGVGVLAVKEACYELTGASALSGNKLVVGEQGDLKLSTTTASFTNGVQVDNASLQVSGTALTANVSATNGGSFAMSDSASLAGDIAVEGGTVAITDSSVSGNISLGNTAEAASIANSSVTGNISTQGSGSATLTALTLTGEITTEGGGRIITASAYNGSSATYAAATLSGSLNWGGETGHSLSLTSGSLYLDGKVKLSELSVGGGLTATVWNGTGAAGEDKILDAVSLGNNAVLQTNDRDKVSAATHIGNLSLAGASATLRDQYHSGYYDIDSLSLGEDITSATLNIVKKADSTLATVVNLGSEEVAAGNFKGTIVLDSDTGETGDSNRSLFLVLGGERTAAGAVINMSAADSDTAVLGLGINTDNAVIAGLSSASGLESRAKVFSGSVGTQVQWGSASAAPSTVGTAFRTLTIDTASGSSHAFYGEIMSNLNLVKTGAGTQKLLGTSANFNGALSIEGGTLALGSSAALGTLAGLSVSDGATLDLSAVEIDTSFAGLSLAAGATGSFSSGAKLAFGALEAETTYHIFDLSSGATLEGWDSNNLGVNNFTINGETLRDLGRVEVALDSESGSFAYYINSYDLVWNGGASGGIWNRTESNTSWLQSFGGITSETSAYFANNDSVSFLSDTAVTLVENVKVGSMTVANGAEVTLTETGALTAESIKVDKDATLTFATEKAGYGTNNISGEGKVVLDLTNSWNNALKLGSSFVGETYVTSGYIDLSGATVGNTLRLADGVNANSATSTTTVTADLILEGTSIIHANGSKPITYEGTVTGENGVFESNGGSSHTFKAEVNLAGFKTSHSGNTNTFDAKTTLGTATISQATVTFAGETDIAEAAISGGTTNFNSTATLASLTQTGGTTNFNSTATLASLTQTGGTINANGTVEVTGKVAGTGGTLALQSGELKLSYNKADGNSINLLDGSKGGSATGTLRLAQNVSVTVAGQIWGRKDSSVVLESGAELVNTEDEVKFSNRGTTEATFRTASSVNDAEYSTNSTNWELTNAHLASTASGAKTLTNKLVNSSVENAGSGKLTVSNSGNSITDVYATAGNIDIEQLNAAVNLNLSELTVAESKTVGLYSGSGDSRVEANVTVTSHAKFGQGAVLNANLTLASGSTLSVAEGGLAMGSTLTLQKGLTLDDTTLGRVHALSVGESTALFTGVDGLTLDKTTYTSLTENDSMLANPYFTNLDSGNQYVLTYSGTDNGTLSIMAASVPEPTTTTLSLLALSALAMRRRRK